jgi:hypothetical protein
MRAQVISWIWLISRRSGMIDTSGIERLTWSKLQWPFMIFSSECPAGMNFWFNSFGFFLEGIYFMTKCKSAEESMARLLNPRISRQSVEILQC